MREWMTVLAAVAAIGCGACGGGGSGEGGGARRDTGPEDVHGPLPDGYQLVGAERACAVEGEGGAVLLEISKCSCGETLACDVARTSSGGLDIRIRATAIVETCGACMPITARCEVPALPARHYMMVTVNGARAFDASSTAEGVLPAGACWDLP